MFICFPKSPSVRTAKDIIPTSRAYMIDREYDSVASVVLCKGIILGAVSPYVLLMFNFFSFAQGLPCNKLIILHVQVHTPLQTKHSSLHMPVCACVCVCASFLVFMVIYRAQLVVTCSYLKAFILCNVHSLPKSFLSLFGGHR